MTDLEESRLLKQTASRALAKAIAYKECGKDAKACEWAQNLVTLLECADILRSET